MDFLTFQASLHPDSLAVTDITFERRWTYGEFNRLVTKLAKYLLHRGIIAGDRVVCISKNRAEVIALHFACARCKGIFVPLNWRLSLDEIEVLLADCEPRLVFGDDKAQEINVSHEPIGNLIQDSVDFYSNLDLEIDNHLPSLILYSSGTTGQPKGAVHTEATLMETVLNSTLLYEVDRHSVFLCEAPMFHVIGLVSSVRPALYNGGQLVISDGFIPERTLDRLTDPELGVTHYFCIPQMSNALRQVDSFEPQNLRRLKALLTGGAPHPEVQIRRWLNDGIAIVDGYGMSEAGTIFGMPHQIDLIDKKAGCVGFHSPRLAVRLHDNQGNLVAIGEPGEVQLKGKNLFVTYWRKGALFADSFTADGWFKTGDIAVQDAEGYYRIVDRTKDMFISGGENVYPGEVEAIVLQHLDVLECAVVGVPDVKWGEVGYLYIVAKTPDKQLNAQLILDYLQQKIAKYKIPKKAFILQSLPRNSGGKVTKQVLRDRSSSDN